MKKDNVAYIAKISILGVIATLMMLFEFALPFAPSFYELDLSEIVVLISGFALGPLAGVLTELVKILLNLLINGTATAFVGEAANFAIGVSFVLPAAIIYKKHKTLRGAIVGMIIGTLSLCVVGALINYYVLIPAFSHFMGMPMEAIIGMGNKVNKSIDS